jgi:SAM-dependent methyltransferase
MHFLEQVRVVLEDFPSTGWILDLGGGGEGVIGLLKGRDVVAIDRRESELDEAPAGPLKIVMDARELRFRDASFQHVTAFFTMCYVSRDDHEAVLREAWRVLAPGGELRIWGVVFPESLPAGKDILVIPVVVELPDARVDTAYGVKWTSEERDLVHYEGLARLIGFELVSCREDPPALFLHLKKPRLTAGEHRGDHT